MWNGSRREYSVLKKIERKETDAGEWYGSRLQLMIAGKGSEEVSV